MQIQHSPLIPIRKRFMANGLFFSPNRTDIKRDIDQKRYATIQTENRYDIDGNKYNKAWTERKMIIILMLLSIIIVSKMIRQKMEILF